jgi:predicted PurR-regulated permease PerM
MATGRRFLPLAEPSSEPIAYRQPELEAMTDSSIPRERFQKAFLVLLVIVISLVFVAMIRRFLIAVLLAAVFSAMAGPLYRGLRRRFGDRAAPAAVVTILVVLLLIVLPLTAFFGIVAAEAIEVTQSVTPWIQRQLSQPDELDKLLQRIPLLDRLQPYQDQITARVGQLAGSLGTFIFNSVGNMTRGTVNFLLQLFIMLYAMFFFLIGGRQILERILYYMPLSSAEESRMVERFVSVTRATIKGTLVIGIVQGGLAGLAVLSIIPGIGTGLIWVPAVIYLFAIGRTGAALGLFAWCAVVVGLADNFLRPYLVGRDTKMSDLLVLLSTLGGLFLFGAVGIIIGPIVAALFVTAWDIYGEAFKDYLPAVQPITAPVEAPPVEDATPPEVSESAPAT